MSLSRGTLADMTYAHRFELVTPPAADEYPILALSLTMGFPGLVIDGEDVSDYARVVSVGMRSDLAVDAGGGGAEDVAVIIVSMWCEKEALSVEPTGVRDDGTLVERYYLGKHDLLTPPQPLRSTASGYIIECYVGELVVRPQVESMIS